MSTLKYLLTEKCSPGNVHSIWVTTSDPLIVYRACIHAKLLVQRYPLSSTHISKNRSDLCPCCHLEEETIEHFLLKCMNHANARNVQLPKIKAILETNNISSSSTNLVQIILDSSLIPNSQYTLMTLTRDLCFNLHLSRMRSTSQDLPPKCHVHIY